MVWFAIARDPKPQTTVPAAPFDLRGREWKENYYVNLNAWKITPEGPAAAEAGEAGGAPLPEQPGESVEDVPF